MKNAGAPVKKRLNAKVDTVSEVGLKAKLGLVGAQLYLDPVQRLPILQCPSAGSEVPFRNVSGASVFRFEHTNAVLIALPSPSWTNPAIEYTGVVCMNLRPDTSPDKGDKLPDPPYGMNASPESALRPVIV